MIERIQTQIDVPATLQSREAQAEILSHCIVALGVMMAESGLQGLQITLQREGNELAINLKHSDAPGDDEIMEMLAQDLSRKGILQDGKAPFQKGMH